MNLQTLFPRPVSVINQLLAMERMKKEKSVTNEPEQQVNRLHLMTSRYRTQ